MDESTDNQWGPTLDNRYSTIRPNNAQMTIYITKETLR